jgi:hypothetical protein
MSWNITRETEVESRAHVRCKHERERAFVSVVCGPYSQEHVIDSLVGLWCGRKFLPATATTGMDVGFCHVDVVEVKEPIFGSHENPSGASLAAQTRSPLSQATTVFCLAAHEPLQSKAEYRRAFWLLSAGLHGNFFTNRSCRFGMNAFGRKRAPPCTCVLFAVRKSDPCVGGLPHIGNVRSAISTTRCNLLRLAPPAA